MIVDTDMFNLNLQDIPPCKDVFTFYYDETGNCRKFRLTENGVNNSNALENNFILGGVAFSGINKQINFDMLFSSLGFDKEHQKELKFKHLFHNSNNFLNFMESKRASTFLNWLDKNDLYIHYCTLNNLYYSLVDIVDSLRSEKSIQYNIQLKNELYNFTTSYSDEVLNILYNHSYPNIRNVALFSDDFCSLINRHESKNNYFLNILQNELKLSAQKGELTFIQDNEPNILINEYYLFYLRRCGMFSKSFHYFDEEPTVQKQFQNITLQEKGEIIKNYSFLPSCDNKFIQGRINN